MLFSNSVWHSKEFFPFLGSKLQQTTTIRIPDFVENFTMKMSDSLIVHGMAKSMNRSYRRTEFFTERKGLFVIDF